MSKPYLRPCSPILRTYKAALDDEGIIITVEGEKELLGYLPPLNVSVAINRPFVD